MKQIGKIIFYYIAGLASIAGIAFTVYTQLIHKDEIKIEVKSLDKSQLTQIPDIKGLKVNYTYQDSVVQNLWKVRYFISNIGEKTIVSVGAHKNILDENLSLIFRDLFGDSLKVLSININETNFPVSIFKDTNRFSFDFKQWKSGEFIDMVAIVESFSSTEPSIWIDERDIMDSRIIYSEYKPNEIEVNKKFIDYFPKGFAIFFKWLMVITIIVMDIVAIFAINKQFKEDPNLKGSIKLFSFFLWLFITVIFSLPLLWIF